jgi:hypothetical protein
MQFHDTGESTAVASRLYYTDVQDVYGGRSGPEIRVATADDFALPTAAANRLKPRRIEVGLGVERVSHALTRRVLRKGVNAIY